MDGHDGTARRRAACNVGLHTCLSLRAALAAVRGRRRRSPDTINVPAGTININNDLVIQSDITVSRGERANERSSTAARSTAASASRRPATRDQPLHGPQRRGGPGRFPGRRRHPQPRRRRRRSTDVRVTGEPRAGRSGGGIANVRGNAARSQRSLSTTTSRPTAAGSRASAGRRCPTATALVDQRLDDRSATRPRSAGPAACRRATAAASPRCARSTIADNTGGAARRRRDRADQQRHAADRARASSRATSSATTSTNCGGDAAVTDAGANVENDKECDFDVTGDHGGRRHGADATRAASSTCSRSPPPARPSIARRCRPATRPGRPTRGCGRDRRARAATRAPSSSTSAATVTITSGPTGTINSSSASFTFSTPRARRDLPVPADGTGPAGDLRPVRQAGRAAATAGSADGSYTFSVRALDGVFPTRRSRHARSRSTPPDTTHHRRAERADERHDADVHVHLSRAAPRRFQCRVDTAAFATCTSPHTTAALAQGAHTFEVRAIDAAGNADRRRPRASFTVDTTAPEHDHRHRARPAASARRSADVHLHSTEPGATFQCALDGAAFGACPSATPASRRARTRSRSAPSTPPATSTAHPRRDRGPSTPSRPTPRSPPARPGRSASTTRDLHVHLDRGRRRRSSARSTAPPSAPARVGYTGLAQGAHTLPGPRRRRRRQRRRLTRLASLDRRHRRARHHDRHGPERRRPTTPRRRSRSARPRRGATFQCRVDAAAFATCTSPLTTAAAGAGRAHVRGPRDRRRRQRRRLAGLAGDHRRHDRARDDDHRRAERARRTTRRRPSRSRRRPGRRSSAGSTPRRSRPAPRRTRRRRWPTASTPSRCARSTRPATSTALPPRATSLVDTTAPEHDDHGPHAEPEQRHDTDVRRSAPRPARPSSAGSTPRRSPPARRRSRARRSPPGRTRSRCARSTPRATSTARPPRRRS